MGIAVKTQGIKYRCQLGLEIINFTRLKTSMDNNKPKMFNAAYFYGITHVSNVLLQSLVGSWIGLVGSWIVLEVEVFSRWCIHSSYTVSPS